MDLGVCPGCGRKWPGGEYCPNCGFIPIGAGLDRLPKKKKKRIGPYREPGSSTPLLLFLAIFGATSSVYQSRPWDDDWDKVRAVFGHPRIHDIEGSWTVVKMLELDPTHPGIFASAGAKEAKVLIDLNTVDVSLTLTSGDRIDVNGSYRIDGTTLQISRFRSDNEARGIFPKDMILSLGWDGEDQVLISTGQTETIDLVRGITDTPTAFERDQATESYLLNEENARGTITKMRGAQH